MYLFFWYRKHENEKCTCLCWLISSPIVDSNIPIRKKACIDRGIHIFCFGVKEKRFGESAREKDNISFLVPSAYRLSPYSFVINKRSFYFFTLYSESRIDFRRLDLQDDLWRYSWHRVWAWHRVILHLATAGWKLLESRYKLRINCNLILQWRRNKWKCLVVEPWSTRRNVSGTTQLVIHSFFIKKKEKCLETMLDLGEIRNIRIALTLVNDWNPRNSSINPHKNYIFL